MAKTNLATMSVGALLKLRDEVGAVLNSKARELKKELVMLGGDITHVVRVARGGTRGAKLAGRKVTPTYRDKHGNQWAGRGAQPVWLREAIKDGAKLEEFLIEKSAAKKRKGGRKKKAA